MKRFEISNFFDQSGLVPTIESFAENFELIWLSVLSKLLLALVFNLIFIFLLLKAMRIPRQAFGKYFFITAMAGLLAALFSLDFVALWSPIYAYMTLIAFALALLSLVFLYWLLPLFTQNLQIPSSSEDQEKIPARAKL